MYSPSKAHNAAWQDWFSVLSKQYLDQHYDCLEILFSVNDGIFNDSSLITAQTCGYPFIKKWANTHSPICVPIFDIPGCNAGGSIKSKLGQYSSWFITFSDNSADSLEQFSGQCVAVNSPHSNSGMNVLRYAISQITSQPSFFAKRLVSGGHWKSMQLVADQHAHIAAIDVISYALIGEIDPSLIKRLKIIGQSVSTMGLPFICTKKADINDLQLCQAMNAAVKQMRPNSRELLHLQGFKAVNRNDYDLIELIEQKAISAGFSSL